MAQDRMLELMAGTVEHVKDEDAIEAVEMEQAFVGNVLIAANQSPAIEQGKRIDANGRYFVVYADGSTKISAQVGYEKASGAGVAYCSLDGRGEEGSI